MFLGEFQHLIDEKNRVAMPAKFRAKLKGGGTVITKGLEKCLSVYQKKEWEKLAEKIGGLSLTKKDSRNFSRFLMSGAAEAEMDKQGRFLISDYLKNYARIKKEVVVIGVYDRVEIWSKELWEEYRATAERRSEEIAENLEGFGP